MLFYFFVHKTNNHFWKNLFINVEKFCGKNAKNFVHKTNNQNVEKFLVKSAYISAI